MKQRIHKLIGRIWEEETLPSEWTEGIICPIYKKGDRMLCSNYRPITLLNVVYKIFTILIHNKLSKIVEDKLEECQMGFRANRSTIDNLFIVRQIIEKCHEFMAFIYLLTVHRVSNTKNKIIFKITGKAVTIIARGLNLGSFISAAV